MSTGLYPQFPDRPITVVLCGVGGQGAITAADLLARAAMAEGFEVKVSEIHGMAQRGGSVSTTVRFGSSVSSMVCDRGQADVLISFELMEALRNLPYMSASGHAVVNDVSVLPMTVLSGKASMPTDLEERLQEFGDETVTVFDAEAVALKAGNRKCANVALLGAASSYLPISNDSWKAAIEGRVPPKTLEANLEAFDLGQALSR